MEWQTRCEPGGDQVLHHLGLPIDHDAAPVGEIIERDVVPFAVELQVDPAVDDALPVQPVRDTRSLEQLDGALLEHAGANARFDVLAAPGLEHDRLDPRRVEKLREGEACWAGTDDRDLGTRALHGPPTTSCATATARLAAGTPQ